MHIIANTTKRLCICLFDATLMIVVWSYASDIRNWHDDQKIMFHHHERRLIRQERQERQCAATKNIQVWCRSEYWTY